MVDGWKKYNKNIFISSYSILVSLVHTRQEMPHDYASLIFYLDFYFDRIVRERQEISGRGRDRVGLGNDRGLDSNPGPRIQGNGVLAN